VRILVATNRDLEREVQAKTFRDDLYYRLKVLPVHVPPLRDRVEDILVLAHHFLERLTIEMRLPRKRLSRAAEHGLQRYGWPGNVRQLENAMRAALVHSPSNVIGLEHFDLGSNDNVTCDLREARDDLERALVERALGRNKGVVSRAARDLSVSRVTLYDLMEKHGLRTKGGERSQG
jgi:two-component system, NtrC family, response regulator